MLLRFESTRDEAVRSLEEWAATCALVGRAGAWKRLGGHVRGRDLRSILRGWWHAPVWSAACVSTPVYSIRRPSADPEQWGVRGGRETGSPRLQVDWIIPIHNGA
ncbi:hypothetical protein [Neoasaia chiangmaiensis]|nr:hypothetical protein [Neoasaia chiangmaiensis]